MHVVVFMSLYHILHFYVFMLSCFFALTVCRVFFIFSIFLYDTRVPGTLLLAGVRCTTAGWMSTFYNTYTRSTSCIDKAFFSIYKPLWFG
jgi:hypothetical protein